MSSVSATLKPCNFKSRKYGVREQAEVGVMANTMVRLVAVDRQQWVVLIKVQVEATVLGAGVEAVELVRETDAVISGSILLLAGVVREAMAGKVRDIGTTQQTEGLVVGTAGEDIRILSDLKMIYIRKIPDCTVNGLLMLKSNGF